MCKKLFSIVIIFGIALGGANVVLASTTLPPNAKVYYYLHDHLGGIDKVLDDKGNVVEERDYLPFGDDRSPEATEPNTDYGFTGKEKDPETDLYYYGARYYDPVIGRFTSMDPLTLGQSEKPLESVLSNPQALNGYSYALNNPLRYVDASGQYEKDVHLNLTVFLAEQAGFDGAQAFSIALYNQFTDVDPETAPIQYDVNAREDYHFVNSERYSELFNTAKETLDDKDIGQFMHAHQDSYSHEGYQATFGHLFSGHKPDKTYDDPQKANNMAFTSFMLLRYFKFLKEDNDSKDVKKFLVDSVKIWDDVKGTVDNFNNAKDNDEKKRTLSDYQKAKDSK
ncbi:MAG: RHS repeat-associated core domain-containing protein [Fibrobacterota bacterium]